MQLIAELKRRNVIRMGGLYLVGAWLITQVAATVLPLFGAPDWLARSVVVALGIGFIPALAFAWIFEVTPDGIKRDDEVPLDFICVIHAASSSSGGCTRMSHASIGIHGDSRSTRA